MNPLLNFSYYTLPRAFIQLERLTLQNFNVTMTLVLTALFDGLCDLLFPHICLLCQKHLAIPDKKIVLCSHCLQSLQRNRPPFCRKCSRPLEKPFNNLCPTCRRFSFDFNAAWAACLYNEPVRQLIHLYKYDHKTVLRHHFFSILFSFITSYRLPLNHALVVPVPLHAARLRERGYNQAQLLAQLISRQYRIPMCINNLVRIRNTESQSILSQKERWTNIQHAFRIKRPIELKDKKILLIDDLLTTGATASEAAKTLKEAGARRVDVLTIAVTALE